MYDKTNNKKLDGMQMPSNFYTQSKNTVESGFVRLFFCKIATLK